MRVAVRRHEPQSVVAQRRVLRAAGDQDDLVPGSASRPPMAPPTAPAPMMM